jgi:hypothetical protein
MTRKVVQRGGARGEHSLDSRLARLTPALPKHIS